MVRTHAIRSTFPIRSPKMTEFPFGDRIRRADHIRLNPGFWIDFPFGPLDRMERAVTEFAMFSNRMSGAIRSTFSHSVSGRHLVTEFDRMGPNGATRHSVYFVDRIFQVGDRIFIVVDRIFQAGHRIFQAGDRIPQAGYRISRWTEWWETFGHRIFPPGMLSPVFLTGRHSVGFPSECGVTCQKRQ